MKVGDLVKTKRGYSVAGLVLEITEKNTGRLVRVLWPDALRLGGYLEHYRDLKVVSEV